MRSDEKCGQNIEAEQRQVCWGKTVFGHAAKDSIPHPLGGHVVEVNLDGQEPNLQPPKQAETE